jgi:hypothetical protein
MSCGKFKKPPAAAIKPQKKGLLDVWMNGLLRGNVGPQADSARGGDFCEAASDFKSVYLVLRKFSCNGSQRG